MTSEREKLIEIWLDNAGERQYQFAFRNALLGAGHTLLHNTSHTSLELGKDILAIGPKGEVIAYQLKGNPGGRLTMSQWHSLIPQINALVYQPITHPSIKAGTPHTPVLVTNGEIHEEVLAAIVGYNAGVPTHPTARPLQVMARGEILKLILKSADTLWPVDIRVQRNILNLFVSPGDDELPTQAFVDLLVDILKGKYTDVAIPAAHLITSIISSNWIEKQNYFELAKIYALLTVSAICYQARWKKQRKKDGTFIEEMIFDLRSHLRSFVEYLAHNYNKRPLVNDNTFAEFGYFHPRKKMISGLASIAMLDEGLDLDANVRDFLWKFVCKEKHSKFLLSEGIVPYCLAEFWALSKNQGTKEPDRRLYSLLNDILICNDQEDDQKQLPGPYYSLQQVVRWRYKLFLQRFRSAIDRESHYRRSWFAESLFFLLARRNYKSACQAAWPTLTKFIHVATIISSTVDFGPRKCETALSEDKIIDTSTARSWDEIVTEASACSVPRIPAQLIARPLVVLTYCLFVPQRMTRDVVLWLDRAFCRSWY